MFNNLNNENIITKSQMYEQMLPAKILGDSFAKTLSYDGIKSNFCLDIPEILEEEGVGDKDTPHLPRQNVHVPGKVRTSLDREHWLRVTR